MIVYRGGPERGSRYSELAAEGRATEYNSDGPRGPTRDEGDRDLGFGRLIVHRMEGIEGSVDYVEMMEAGGQDRIIIAEGPQYCGRDGQFQSAAARIGRAGHLYDTPFEPGRSDNSNAVVRTMLNELRLSERAPDVLAPGWARDLIPRTHFPAGEVSSARLRGVTGMIEAGSETNALDVIAEEHRRR